MTAKVSVCIAVYNVEKFIEQCVRSLFEQTLEDLEYIFVDDCSSDHSIDIMLQVLEEYPLRKNQVKLIRHNINKGVAKTRCDAINAATGEYIIHCDPDDWVEFDMYETLYKKAVADDADMVYCSFFKNNDEAETIINQEEFYNWKDIVNSMIFGEIHGSLGNKLYKKNILDNADWSLPENIIMSEDLRLNVQFLQSCKNISYCSRALYHYRYNDCSLTTSPRSEKSFQSVIDNVLFFEQILPERLFKRSIEKQKQLILLEGLQTQKIPAKLWHSLWKREKFTLFYQKWCPVKLKCIFYLACINYSWAAWLWKMYDHKRKSLQLSQNDNK